MRRGTHNKARPLAFLNSLPQFLNHPQLSAMISDRDEDALSYMTSLQVPVCPQGDCGEMLGEWGSSPSPREWGGGG